MTQAPFVIRGARDGIQVGRGDAGRLADVWADGYVLRIAACRETAENLAAEQRITRSACGCIRAAKPAGGGCGVSAPGNSRKRLLPVEVKQGKKTITVTEDDHRRPETTMETLAKLPPSFRKDGIVTAGNASGIVDGAAAVVVTHAKTAKERGLKPLGRIVAWATAGVAPQHHGRSGRCRHHRKH